MSALAALDRRPRAHKVFLRALPYAIARRFDPLAAGDLEALFELCVRDPGGGNPAQFALRISGGICEVTPGVVSKPDAIATLGADDLIRMVSGATGFPALLASGRLELNGNPFLALRFPGLFRLPARTRSSACALFGQGIDSLGEGVGVSQRPGPERGST